MIPIAQPIIEKEEIERVVDVLKSGALACGEVVDTFEHQFAEYLGVQHAVANSSGTTALHAALIAADVQAGDKVITTPFTFAATANSILFQKAVPLFADIDPETFNIKPESIEELLKKHKVKAILIVHLFGLPCDMDAIMSLSLKYGVVVIEDCAQSHGAQYKEKMTGSFGLMSAFSFYPTKNMTTGEGGMVATNDPSIYKKLKKIINHGQAEKYVHDLLGYNYRMTNLAAAIGLEQLKKLDKFVSQRRTNALYYDMFIDNENVSLPTQTSLCRHAYHQYTVRVQHRKKFIELLTQAGIGTGIYYPIPLNAQPLYQSLGYNTDSTPVATKISKQVVSIPVHPKLTLDDLMYITEVINQYE